jgi:putative membrane-bound dehydrogenase-like protein
MNSFPARLRVALLVLLSAGLPAGALAAAANTTRPLHILYLGDPGAMTVGRGGRGSPIGGISASQNAAVTALTNAVAVQVQTATAAAAALQQASFAQPADPAAVQARANELGAAELALANARAAELARIQAGADHLTTPQLFYVMTATRGGTTPPTYAYLPGQTLAPDGIYFDYVTNPAELTPAYLQHFDAAIVALPPAQISAALQRQLDQFRAAGHGVRNVTSRPSEEDLRASVPGLVGAAAMGQYRAFLAGREPLRYEKKDGVANYERRIENLPVPQVLSPQESMKHVQVPADFRLEVFAAEPDIGRPISLAWDERGRLWLVEAVDYPSQIFLDAAGNPTGEGNDRIRICEDTNGDGRADKFTIFADKLNMATSLTFVNGGVMVAVLRNFVFLKDTNGDDKADERTVIFPSSFGTRDTHAIASNLTRGFDNWLYGTVGYSGFMGTVGGVAKNFQQGVYRFKADGSAMEFLHQFTNNTWGMGFNAAGDVFGSTANNQPSFFGGIPATAVPPAPAPAGGGRGGAGIMTAKALAPGMPIHPNTPNVRQVDQMGGYTAAAGHRFMVSDALPARLQGNALVTEPTAKLIGVMKIQPDGAGYAAKDGFNLLASSDEWMSPVYADVGPDGAIWVADFQNFIIQHNPVPTLANAGFQSSNGPGAAHVSPLRTNSYGRVYRVVWQDGAAAPIRSLAGANAAALVAALDSGNLFWRETAQRLIVDNKRMDTVAALKAAVKEKDGRPTAIHALWALQGLGALDRDLHRSALQAKDPALRRNAVRALESSEAGSKLFFESAVVNDPDLQTRLAAFVKLAQFPTTPAIQTVVTQLRKDPKNAADEWLGSANAGLMLVRAHKVPDAELDAPPTPLRAGDAVAGEAIFRTSAIANCIACHTVGGTGGAVGPRLDGIAARQNEAYLRESVLDPGAKLADGYTQLGISPMPPMSLILKSQEIEDVVAYLLTLKTPAR